MDKKDIERLLNEKLTEEVSKLRQQSINHYHYNTLPSYPVYINPNPNPYTPLYPFVTSTIANTQGTT